MRKHKAYMDTSINRHHPLYERHIQYVAEKSYDRWFKERRLEDKREWELIKLKLEKKAELEVEQLSRIVHARDDKENRRQIELEEKKERKRLRKIARQEARKEQELQRKHALKLFYGTLRDKSFIAWKEYTQFMKEEREKNKCTIM